VVASQRAAADLARAQEVSIPFIAGQWSLQEVEARREAEARVSIPFIAGQWSLRFAAADLARAQERFNPLHCGAVVASHPPLRARRRRWPVSIPFIAGQWSLLPRTTPSSLFGVLLRKRRLPCDHIICTRLPF
jgi:hypothetical protein